MELVAGQVVAAGVEVGDLPQPLERRPGLVPSGRLIPVDVLDHEAHPRAVRQGGPLIGLEDAVFEGGT